MEKGATGRPFCFHGKPRGSADEAADDEELGLMAPRQPNRHSRSPSRASP